MFPKSLSSSQLPVVERNKAEDFSFKLEKMLQREEVSSTHFITYLWAEIVGFVKFYSKLHKSFVVLIH